MKFQTSNSKSDNLSFKVFFLFFANFSRLTAVKPAGTYTHSDFCIVRFLNVPSFDAPSFPGAGRGEIGNEVTFDALFHFR